MCIIGRWESFTNQRSVVEAIVELREASERFNMAGYVLKRARLGHLRGGCGEAALVTARRGRKWSVSLCARTRKLKVGNLVLYF